MQDKKGYPLFQGMGRVVPFFFISQSFNIKGRKSSWLSYNSTLSKHFVVQETKRAEPEWKKAADDKRQRLRSEFKYNNYTNITWPKVKFYHMTSMCCQH